MQHLKLISNCMRALSNYSTIVLYTFPVHIFNEHLYSIKYNTYVYLFQLTA